MNILLVDDDIDLCEIIKLTFELEGYNVVVSYTLEDAYLNLNNIDLVLVDSYSGHEFAFAKFCKSKGICVVYHTGRVNITDEQHAIFDHVIEKPSFTYLIKCIKNIISTF
jgi:DNA-binding response OmpR family regulator